MGLLAWIIVGLIAGWLTGQVMRGGGYGLVGDIILGIVGGIVGGFIAGALLGIPDAVSGVNPTSVIVAFIGGIIVVAVVRAVGRPARI